MVSNKLNLSTLLLALCVVLTLSTTAFARYCPNELKVTVGTYTFQSWLPTSAGKGVTFFRLRRNSLRLSQLIPNITTGENPAYCANGPRALYCVNEISEGTVTAITGKTSKSFPTNASGSTHLAVFDSGRGTRIFTANYGGGSVSSILVKRDGSSTLYTDTIDPKFSSAKTGQQSEPHPHMVLYIGGPRIMIPDLGADRLWIYVVGYDSKLLWRQSFKMRRGDGPRHAVGGKGNNVYVLNEISNSVVRVRGCSGSRFRECERKNLLYGISKTVNGDSSAAIRISRDYKYLYASLRKDGDIFGKIVAFKLASDGAILNRVGVYSSGGIHPRDFNIIENAPDCNSYIAVANRDSDNLVLFKRNRRTGAISTKASFVAKVHTPTSVLV